MFKKLKSLIADDTIFTASLLILVGLASFGFGRLSLLVVDQKAPQVAAVTLIAQPEAPVATNIFTSTTTPVLTAIAQATSAPAVTGPYVGSKSGTKYHLTTCPGAKQIKPQNKIFFTTVADARAAGYTPAASCPGL